MRLNFSIEIRVIKSSLRDTTMHVFKRCTRILLILFDNMLISDFHFSLKYLFLFENVIKIILGSVLWHCVLSLCLWCWHHEMACKLSPTSHPAFCLWLGKQLKVGPVFGPCIYTSFWHGNSPALNEPEDGRALSFLLSM